MPDPEVDAMGLVANALGDLDDAARARVLKWAASRYGVAVAVGRPDGGEALDVDLAGDQQREGQGVGFEHFAELFDATSPTTNADKALVAAYWIQVHEGNEQWSSSSLNSQLKNLGHPIANITTALDANMDRQPKRVIQLKKSGNSQQARKTYKLTTEGVRVVKQMLTAGEG
jgi:hypothetical protein